MGAPGDLLVTTPHGFQMGRVAWSSDGRWVAAAAKRDDFVSTVQGAVTVIDSESGRVRWVAEDWEAGALAVHPSDHSLAVASSVANPFEGFRRDRIRVLDFATGVQLWAFDGLRAMSMAFSPDGRLLAIADERARLLDAETGAERFDLGPSSDFRMTPAFSADSRWVVSADPSRAFVLDTQTGARRWDVAVPGNAVHVAFDEDDRQVVVVCHPATVLTLDSTTGAVRTNAPLEGTFPLDLFAIRGFALSPDRRLLIRANLWAIGVYAVADGRRRSDVRTVSSAGGLRVGVQASPVAAIAAVTAAEAQPEQLGGVTLIDLRTGTKVWERSAVVRDVAFSPDGRRLAVSGGVDGAGFVNVHDTGVERARWPHGGAVTAVSATSGGIRLVATASADRKVSVTHADTGQLLYAREHPGVVPSIVFSPQGQWFATAGSDGGVRLYDTLSGQRLWPVTPGRSVGMVAFTPDGTGVVSASADKTARLIDRDSGEERWRRVHPQAVSLVAVSPDGRWVATGCADRATRILDAATGAELFGFPSDGRVRGLAFGPAGSVLASASDIVLLIDPATGREVGEVVHPLAVTAVAISRDGTLLASGGGDSAVRLTPLGGTAPVLVPQLSFAALIVKLAFNPVARRLAVVTEDFVVRIVDPDNGIELARYVHPAIVRDIAFTPDGELLATACDDGYARVFSGG